MASSIVIRILYVIEMIMWFITGGYGDILNHLKKQAYKNKPRCPYGKERGVEELVIPNRVLFSMEILLLVV